VEAYHAAEDCGVGDCGYQNPSDCQRDQGDGVALWLCIDGHEKRAGGTDSYADEVKPARPHVEGHCAHAQAGPKLEGAATEGEHATTDVVDQAESVRPKVIELNRIETKIGEGVMDQEAESHGGGEEDWRADDGVS